MIEFIETYTPTGMRAALSCAELPAGMSCRITVAADGRVSMRTKANGKGSIRYHTPTDYAAAVAQATRWARRKIAGA